jgi:hypothetical protein
MLTLGLAFIKSSAQTELKGVTVFDPIILNDPERAGAVVVGAVVVGVVAVGVELALHPAKVKAITSISARGMSHSLTDWTNLFSPST